jgi:hypothetical protein
VTEEPAGARSPAQSRLGILGRGLPFDRMAVGLLFVAFGFAAALTPAQNDTFWHLRAGADIWRTGHLPRFDTYSHTAAGARWPNHEWLSQALMYAVYCLGGGMPGLEFGAAALILLTGALLDGLMVGPRLTRLGLLTLGLVLSSCVWTLRPQVVSLLFLVLLVWLLARERHFLIPPLFVVWANAHGGVALGGLVLVSAATVAGWRALRVGAPDDRHRAVVLAVVLPLAGLAAAATPLGFGIFRFVIDSTVRSVDAQILEWYAPRPNSVFGALFWVVTLAMIVLLIVRRRALAGGSWADWMVVVAAFVLLPFAARSQRNIGPFMILATPAFSRLLGSEFRFWRRRRPRPPSPDHPRVNLALLAAACLAAVVMLPFGWRRLEKLLFWHPIPDRALAAVRACPGPLYNQYNEGGTLIWFAPETPVFVDGRQDPYPPSFLRENLAIGRGEPYRAMFARYGIKCAFLPASAKLAGRLRADGWRARYLDEDWVVLDPPRVD